MHKKSPYGKFFVLRGEVFGAIVLPITMSENLARKKLSPKYTRPAPEVARALAFLGLFTRVAQKECLSTGHVLQVAKGRRTSRRVIEALIREVRRIERESGRAA